MDDTPNLPDVFARSFLTPAFKLFLIGVLIIVLLVPLGLVSQLVGEREQRADSVRAEIAGVWGGTQLINGPILVVPYTVLKVTMQGDKRIEEVIERRAAFLPERLAIKGRAASKVLHRSIFDVSVYASELTFEGRFAAPQLADVAADVQTVRWRDAVLALAISDVSGLKAAASATINADRVLFNPSLGVPDANLNGIHLKLADSNGLFAGSGAGAGSIPPFDFRFELSLNGSSELGFAPVARETSVELSSDWPHPSFAGAFLPTERTIDANGFSARWQVPHLARSVPQAWSLKDGGLDRIRPYWFGTKFYLPLDFYKVITRATKYALMFLGVAFMVVFLIELKSPRAVHPVQYLFVGVAMVFFYVLLLSFAEYLGFARAYLAAAGATGIMLSAYVARVQASLVKGAVMLVVFLILYAFLYLLLRLEDYALLAGAILGFILLTAVMFATLRVNWSGRDAGARPVPAEPSGDPA